MADSYPSFFSYVFWVIAALCLFGVAGSMTPAAADQPKRGETIFGGLILVGVFVGLGFVAQGSRSEDALRKANHAVAVAQANLDAANRDYIAATSGDGVAASSSQSMTFDACTKRVQEMGTQLGTAGDNLVETSIMRMVRFPTVDGSVLITCSKPDRKMVITRSARR